MTNIPPELLAAILASQVNDQGDRQTLSYVDPGGSIYQGFRGRRGGGTSTDAGDTFNGWQDWTLYQDTPGSDTNYAFNQQGQFQEAFQEDNGWGDFIKALALMAPAVAGVAGAAGATVGAPANSIAAGTAAAPAWTAAVPGEMAASLAGMPAATVTPGLLASMPALPIAGAAAGGAAGGLLGGGGYTTAAADSQLANAAGIGGGSGGAPAGVNLTNAGGVMSTGSGWGNIGDWLSNGKNLAGIAGGLLGAYEGRGGQQQTQSREPWQPAQAGLIESLDRTRNLGKRLSDQPFSPLQQTAYNNRFGLLNAMNQATPQMMAGFGANASGANNYDRSNPRRGLLGSNVQMNWLPGLLTGFGG